MPTLRAFTLAAGLSGVAAGALTAQPALPPKATAQAPSRRTNITVGLSRFIGREDDLVALGQLVQIGRAHV